ncbi:MAG: VOC family protein, partial [Fusobacteria bacterium]|nr:VOC family protein [Fusobacteriota bacterium]
RAYNTWLGKNGFYIELQTPKEGKIFEPIHTEVAGINHLCFYSPNLEVLFHEIKRIAPTCIVKPLYTVFSTALFKIKAPEGTIIEFRNNLSS